ncbi:amidase [Celeribacter neptunius]|uniref:Amidase n=1 Tax=Celeribacter neptunius TaxID=588602 RepID=A0A1I3NLT1_9RHOB|nr:amidase [Celeribacter neptunius]SFJ10127.1 amidase [Celeribacter neptunius]
MNAPASRNAALVQALDLGGDGPRVAVKDCIDITGTVTGCGSAAFAGAVPATEHAEIVGALLDAGCKIVGKANMHELAFGMTGVNGFTGTPVNPIWPDRIPGGSSSGSAVAVAAGLCDFAVGTDTGGSIRQPATCCGVFGIKPTFGRVSRKGLTPRHSSLDCPGILARDMEMLTRGMAAIDPSFQAETLIHAPKLGRIKSEGVAPEVGDPLVYALMDAYPDMPYELLPSFEAAFDAGMVVMSHEMAQEFGPMLDRGAPFGPDIAARLAKAQTVSAAQLAEAEEIRTRFTAEVDALLSRYDALVTPSLPMVPPTLDAAKDPQNVLSLTRYQRPFNLSGHPALTLPARNNAGLPIGLQIVGRKGEDAKLCAIARWITSCIPLFQSKDRTQ